MARVRRAEVLGAVAAGCAVLATAATFLGWGRSGRRTRTSYEIVDVADRAGVLPDVLSGVAPVWYLVPALCGLVVLASALRRHRLTGAAATTLGALVGAGAVLVERSPLVAAPAARAAVVLATCTVLSGAAVLGTARKETVG